MGKIIMVAATYKFPNNMVSTFGYNDQQIPGLQGKYTFELHKRIMKYSDENTIWKGDWNINER